MKWARRIIPLLAVVVILAAVVLLVFLPAGTRKQSALGEFELLGVTVAGQEFREGSAFERLFEKFIPSSGLRIGRWQVRKPAHYPDPNEAPITAWILYRGTNILRPTGPHLVQSQVVVEDSSGKRWENPQPFVRRSTWTANLAGKPSARHEMLISVPIADFPTDEGHFTLRFSAAPATGTEQDWVAFTIKNGLPLHPRVSTPQVPVQTNLLEGKPIVLRAIKLRPASFEFRMAAANWTVDHCTLEDGSGTQFTSSGSKSRGSSSPPEMVYECNFNQSIEAGQNWRINLTLVDLTDFPAEARRLVRLSSEGPPQTITNQAGHVFSCAFDGYSLSITGRSSDSVLHRWGWFVAGATNEASGEELRFPKIAPVIPTDPISQTWRRLDAPCSNIVLQLAYPRVVTTQFVLTPTDALPARKAKLP